jgi:Site-specific recombinases, DNA invertase Pin homologs
MSTEPAVVGYARVSTADQSLERQLSSIFEFAEREHDVDRAAVEILRDKSTGTNTQRDGYQELMNRVEGGRVDAVVVESVSRIARSISDLQRTADRVREADTELHVVSEGLSLEPGSADPYQQALFSLLGVFAELEAEIKRKNVKEGIAARQDTDEYHHGRAPLGFEKDSGRLIEGPEYHRVVSVLDQVAKDEKSKRKAAADLDSSRRTVQRAVEERADLYGL